MAQRTNQKFFTVEDLRRRLKITAASAQFPNDPKIMRRWSLFIHGLNYEDIAKLEGVSNTAIRKTLNKLIHSIGECGCYKCPKVW